MKKRETEKESLSLKSKSKNRASGLRKVLEKRKKKKDPHLFMKIRHFFLIRKKL